MTNGDYRAVFQREDGLWVNQALDEGNPASLHRTQREAEEKARRMLGRRGGGALILRTKEGRIQSKETVPPR